MVQESTVICVDNSEYMRNGDYAPTRLHAQNEAVGMICSAKIRSHPENAVGLVTLNNGRVIVTLTNEVIKLQAYLHQVQPQGLINFETGIRVAHLALKHRQGRNHKMRIVVFVGSPVIEDEKDLVRLAKRLKKEKVNVDVVSFGQEGENSDKLSQFINTLNGKDGVGSHLVTIPPGPQLADALKTSPVLRGEDGGEGENLAQGFDVGDDQPDPELQLALRMSMEEERARQEMEHRNAMANQSGASTAASASAGASLGSPMDAEGGVFANVASESAGPAAGSSAGYGLSAAERDLAAMTEEEQLAYAMHMSMNELNQHAKEEAMETDDVEDKKNSDKKPPSS